MHFSLRTSINVLLRFLELIVLCLRVDSVSEEKVSCDGRSAASRFNWFEFCRLSLITTLSPKTVTTLAGE